MDSSFLLQNKAFNFIRFGILFLTIVSFQNVREDAAHTTVENMFFNDELHAEERQEISTGVDRRRSRAGTRLCA